jgi:hypothetical protein
LNNTPLEKSNPSRLLRFSCDNGADTLAAELSSIEPLNVVRFKTQPQ